MKNAIALFLFSMFAFTAAGALDEMAFARRVKCEVQDPDGTSLERLTFQQGTTPLVDLYVLNRGRPIATDTTVTARLVFGPTSTGAYYVAVTNYAVTNNSYLCQVSTVGTNSAAATNGLWWYTVYFDRGGQTFWTGSGELAIEATTSTADGLSWQAITSSGAVAAHNTNGAAHADIRALIPSAGAYTDTVARAMASTGITAAAVAQSSADSNTAWRLTNSLSIALPVIQAGVDSNTINVGIAQSSANSNTSWRLTNTLSARITVAQAGVNSNTEAVAGLLTNGVALGAAVGTAQASAGSNTETLIVYDARISSNATQLGVIGIVASNGATLGASNATQLGVIGITASNGLTQAVSNYNQLGIIGNVASGAQASADYATNLLATGTFSTVESDTNALAKLAEETNRAQVAESAIEVIATNALAQVTAAYAAGTNALAQIAAHLSESWTTVHDGAIQTAYDWGTNAWALAGTAYANSTNALAQAAASLQPAATNGWTVSEHLDWLLVSATNGWEVSAHTDLVTRSDTNGWTVSSHDGLVADTDTNGWIVTSHDDFVTKTMTNGWEVSAHADWVERSDTNGWVVSAHLDWLEKSETNGWEVSSHAALVADADTNGWEVSPHGTLVPKTGTNGWIVSSHAPYDAGTNWIATNTLDTAHYVALEGALNMTVTDGSRDYAGRIPSYFDAAGREYTLSNMFSTATLYGGAAAWDLDYCDKISLWDGSAMVNYYYVDVEDGEGVSWHDESFVAAPLTVVTPGQFYVYKRVSNSCRTITIAEVSRLDPYYWFSKDSVTQTVAAASDIVPSCDALLKLLTNTSARIRLPTTTNGLESGMIWASNNVIVAF